MEQVCFVFLCCPFLHVSGAYDGRAAAILDDALCVAEVSSGEVSR